MTKGSDNLFPSVLAVEQGSTPANPASGNQRLFIDSADHKLKRVNSSGTVTTIESSGGAAIGTDGWVAVSDTWTYSSADGGTGIVTVPSDATTKYSVGMRVKYTQTTVKYGIITAITATTITFWGGTDYTLANAALSSISYSPVKEPYGFPADPAKWKVRTTDTSDQTQASPVNGTWYNIGGINIVLPIGAWRVFYEVAVDLVASVSTIGCDVTLSTGNNSETDKDWSAYHLMELSGGSGTMRFIRPFTREKEIVLASKTTYYLNGKATVASITNIDFRGDLATTIIEAVSAYL